MMSSFWCFITLLHSWYAPTSLIVFVIIADDLAPSQICTKPSANHYADITVIMIYDGHITQHRYHVTVFKLGMLKLVGEVSNPPVALFLSGSPCQWKHFEDPYIH